MKETAGTGGGRTQGLTTVESRVDTRFRVHSVAEAGRTCVWLENVVIDLTPASVEIIVPSDYAFGSCEYDAILTHEQEHERIYRERLLAAAAEVGAALNGADWLPARGNPVPAADPNAAEAELNAKIRKVVDPVHAKYKAELGAAQAELDRPERYASVTKRCPGWK